MVVEKDFKDASIVTDLNGLYTDSHSGKMFNKTINTNTLTICHTLCLENILADDDTIIYVDKDTQTGQWKAVVFRIPHLVRLRRKTQDFMFLLKILSR